MVSAFVTVVIKIDFMFGVDQIQYVLTTKYILKTPTIYIEKHVIQYIFLYILCGNATYHNFEHKKNSVILPIRYAFS